MRLALLVFPAALGFVSLAFAAPPTSHFRPGSSCAHPVTVTLGQGQRQALYENQSAVEVEPRHLVPGLVAVVKWNGLNGDIICSARIQRRDGSWVGPDRLIPYQTPTPIAGEYLETTDPKTQVRQVVVSFAKSQVRKGASCDYPLSSIAGFSETQDPSASFRVNTPRPGMDEIAVTVHKPNIVICRATAVEMAEPDPGHGSPFEILRELPITIGPHGGLSSPLPIPTAANHILRVVVYARRLPTSKPPHPKPDGACTLTTRYYAQGSETGNTKAFSVKFKLVGTAQPNSDLPWRMNATIRSHDPHLAICRLNLNVTVPEANPTGGGIVTEQAHIKPHGGVSSTVTFPAHSWGPEADIYARRVAKASAATLHKSQSARRKSQCGKALKQNTQSSPACKPKLACNLTAAHVQDTEEGDTKDFGVVLRALARWQKKAKPKP